MDVKRQFRCHVFSPCAPQKENKRLGAHGLATKTSKNAVFDAIFNFKCFAFVKKGATRAVADGCCVGAPPRLPLRRICHGVQNQYVMAPKFDVLDSIPQVKYNIAQVEYEIQADLY